MNKPLALLATVLCTVGLRAATPPAPSFPNGTIDLPPLSLNDIIKGGTFTQPFHFGTPLPSYGTIDELRRSIDGDGARIAREALRNRPKVASSMPVIEPRHDVDYKMRIREPDPNIDFKMIVKDPGAGFGGAEKTETKPQK